MEDLRVAILHYHLRGGGVTRIIEHTFEALRDQTVKLCVITGEQPPDDFTVSNEGISVVEGLSYGDKNPDREPQELFKEVQASAAEKLGGEPHVWHIHNHSLGKNAAVTEMVLLLAENSPGVLLHIHDFAEDNRPENYQYLSTHSSSQEQKPLVNRLYPLGPHIHYAVLNGRDHKFLQGIGIKEERLHLLSNPVDIDVADETTTGANSEKISGKLYLYPSRVIPRKNIGEFILWSALAAPDEHFAVTLAPKNPKYKTSYQNWKAFVKENELPVTFEAGSVWGMSYPDLLRRADAFLTTSIAEGFGLIYLESWLAGKPLLGRLLSNIVADFKNKNICFPGMYDKLQIPVEWLGKKKLTERFEEAIRSNLNKYEINFTQQQLQQWLDKLLADDRVDFGKLDESLQKQAITLLIEQPDLKKQMLPAELFEKLPTKNIIEANKAVIEKEFNLERYGERLMRLYQNIRSCKTSKPDYADSDSLLKQFQSPENFALLRS